MVKILLVEDNELNRDMLKRRLKRRGYDVAIAVDGAEGVSMATSENFDLILMDLSLPIMNGWDATRTLRANSHTSSIPIIALTAHAMVGDKDKALAAGCDDYDTKPVEFKRLLGKIEALLANRPEVSAPSLEEISTVSQAIEQPMIKEVHQQQNPIIPEKASSDTFQVKAPQREEAGVPDGFVGGKILIVDDNEDNWDMLSRRLERKGYSIIVADSGEAALEIINQELVEIVLLDVMMPGIDGIETLKRIRQTYSQARLPVVMVTAKDRDDDIVQAFALGANDYITKPIDFVVAAARIQAQLASLQAIRQQVAAATIQQVAEPPLQQVAEPSLQQVADISLGGWLGERYQVTRVLTQELFSQTIVVRDTQQPDMPQYLLKRFHFKTEEQSFVEMASQFFTSEIKTLKQLSQHEKISTLLNCFTQERDFYLLQEFVDGSPLTDKLEPNNSLKLLDVLKLTRDILRTLESFHQKQLIHSNIQPSNLLYRKQDGELLLIDYGITGRMLIQFGQQFSQHRKLLSNQWEYMPLEQRQGHPVFGSDIYAVGMIAVQALTGKRLQELVNPITGELKWRDFAQVNESVARLLDRMVCPDYKERYSSIKAALEDILFHIKILSSPYINHLSRADM
jgi:CheY-like chemotaxis protein